MFYGTYVFVIPRTAGVIADDNVLSKRIHEGGIVRGENRKEE